MNIDIRTDESTIGKNMYEYVKANGISRDKKREKTHSTNRYS
jgi:hypothetical protein